jgi:hypothetical protein
MSAGWLGCAGLAARWDGMGWLRSTVLGYLESNDMSLLPIPLLLPLLLPATALQTLT